jgi:hypothetical protein
MSFENLVFFGLDPLLKEEMGNSNTSAVLPTAYPPSLSDALRN